jgi:8-oxo-dGTP diphosphatase
MNPVFGDKLDHVDYMIRNGAYAVIIEDNAVAAMQGPGGFFLPGGGVEENEDGAAALTRELKEECDASIERLRSIGQATDFLFSSSENRHFEKRGRFYLARFLTRPNENVIWMPLHDAPKLFRQAGHAWAVSQAIEKQNPEPIIAEG